MESLDAINSVYFITEHWFLCRVRHSRAVKESGWVQTDLGSNTCLLVQFHLASGLQFTRRRHLAVSYEGGNAGQCLAVFENN